MKFQFAPLIAILAFASCNSTETNQQEATEQAPEEQPFERTEIDTLGFKLTIAIPEDYRRGNVLEIEMNEAYGQLEIRSGDVFHLEIIEETANQEQLIQQLEQDLIFDFSVVEENEAGILYRQYLPQGGQEFWHFYIAAQQQNRQYIIRDASMSELNEYQSRKMFEALSYAILSRNSQSPV